jgi:hypothetical protein
MHTQDQDPEPEPEQQPVRSLRFLPQVGGQSRRRTLASSGLVLAVVAVAAAALVVPLALSSPRSSQAPAGTQAGASATNPQTDGAVPTADLSGWTPQPDVPGGVIAGQDGGGGSGSDPSWWQGIHWTVPPLKAGQVGVLDMYGIGKGWCAGNVVFPTRVLGPGVDPVIGTNTIEPNDYVDPFPVTLDMPENYVGVSDLQLNCYPVEHSFAGKHLFHIPLVTSAPDPWTFQITPVAAVAGQPLRINLKVNNPASTGWTKCSFNATLPGGEAFNVPVIGGPDWSFSGPATDWVFTLPTIPAATPTGTLTWSSTCTDGWGVNSSKTGSFTVTGQATPPPTEQPTAPPTDPTEQPTPTEPPAEPT